VRNRNAHIEARHGAAESARRVALDNKQIGTVPQQRKQRRRDLPHMLVRILLAVAAEAEAGIAAKAEIARIEPGMLTRKDESRLNPTRGERMGKGR